MRGNRPGDRHLQKHILSNCDEYYGETGRLCLGDIMVRGAQQPQGGNPESQKKDLCEGVQRVLRRCVESGIGRQEGTAGAEAQRTELRVSTEPGSLRGRLGMGWRGRQGPLGSIFKAVYKL